MILEVTTGGQGLFSWHHRNNVLQDLAVKAERDCVVKDDLRCQLRDEQLLTGLALTGNKLTYSRPVGTRTILYCLTEC